MLQFATQSVEGWRPENPRSSPPVAPPGASWCGDLPVRVQTSGERSRFRFGVLVRGGLLSPHLLALELLWIPVQLGVVIAWFSVMLIGRVPRRLHRLLAGLVRYQTRVAAYGLLLAEPFPGFRSSTSYPFDVDLAGRRRHSRLRALMYLPMVLMLLVAAGTVSLILILLAPLMWLFCLVMGRTPRWYQRGGTSMVSFVAQSLAFGVMVTDHWPEGERARRMAHWHPTPLPEPRAPVVTGSAVARVAMAAGLLVLVGAGVVAGHALWHTTVPTDLSLPHLKASSYFDSDVTVDNAHAEKTAYSWFLGAKIVTLLALAIFAWRGRRLARHSAAGPIGTGMFVGMLGIAWAALAAAPFLLVGVLSLPPSPDTDLAWLYIPIGALGQMANVAIILAIAMAMARKLPRGWPLVAPLVLGVLLAGSVLLTTQVGFDAPKLKDPVLLADAHELAAREGIPNKHIDYIDDRDPGSDAPTPTNAFAVGGGTSADIVIQGSLHSHRELRVMLGHETAHIARNHTRRTVAWMVLFMMLAALIVALAIRRRGDLYNPALIPIALLVFSVASFAWTPIDTALSRRYEAEADWIALQATRDPQGDIALMRDLAIDNDAAPTSPDWARALFVDHPDIMSRIEMAVAWKQRHPSR